MILVLSMMVPFAIAHLVAGRAVLLLSPIARRMVVVAVACQLSAVVAAPGVIRVVVPCSFALGAVALSLVLWQSSRDLVVTSMGAVGAVLNFIPIAAFGAMPVLKRSRAVVSEQALIEPSLISAKHIEVESLTFPLGLAADWIPLPVITGVISPGDVLLLGAILLLGVRSRRSDDYVVQGVAQSPLSVRTMNRCGSDLRLCVNDPSASSTTSNRPDWV